MSADWLLLVDVQYLLPLETAICSKLKWLAGGVCIECEIGSLACLVPLLLTGKRRRVLKPSLVYFNPCYVLLSSWQADAEALFQFKRIDWTDDRYFQLWLRTSCSLGTEYLKEKGGCNIHLSLAVAEPAASFNPQRIDTIDPPPPVTVCCTHVLYVLHFI